MGRHAQRRHQRLGELEGHAAAAQVLFFRWTVGAPRVEYRGGGGELVAREVVVGDDDLDAGAAPRAHGVPRGNAAVAGGDLPGAKRAPLPEPPGPQTYAV